MTSKDKRSTNWCFTWNNYKPEDITSLGTWPCVKYLGYSEETGSSGTPHLQGFVSFTGQKSLNWIKDNCTSKIHLEPMKGTLAQSEEYCSKQSKLITLGKYIWPSRHDHTRLRRSSSEAHAALSR